MKYNAGAHEFSLHPLLCVPRLQKSTEDHHAKTYSAYSGARPDGRLTTPSGYCPQIIPFIGMRPGTGPGAASVASRRRFAPRKDSFVCEAAAHPKLCEIGFWFGPVEVGNGKRETGSGHERHGALRIPSTFSLIHFHLPFFNTCAQCERGMVSRCKNLLHFKLMFILQVPVTSFHVTVCRKLF